MRDNAARTGSSWLAPDTLVASLGLGVLVTVVGRAAGLGRGVVFAHVLDPAELGAWSIAYNAINLISLILVLGIPGGIARYSDSHFRHGQLRSFLLWTGALTMGVALGLGGVAFYYLESLSRWLFQQSERETLTALVLFTIGATVLFNLLQGLLQGLRFIRLIALLQMAQMISFAIGAVVLLLSWRSDAIGGAAALLGSFVLILGILYRVLRLPQWSDQEPTESSVLPHWRTVMWFSLGTWAVGGIGELTRLLDRWLLLQNTTLDVDTSLQMVGSYHLVENVTQPLLSLTVQLSIFVLPHVVCLWEAQQTEKARRLVQTATKLTSIGLVYACALLVFLKPFVLGIIFKDRAGYGSLIFEIMLTAMIVTGANYMVRSYLLCREDVGSIVSSSLCGLGVAAIGNLLLIPQFQLLGAAVSALAAAWVSTFFLLFRAARKGLQPDVGVWISVLILPFALLLPLPLLSALLIIVLGVLLCTNLLLHPPEKELFQGRLRGFCGRLRFAPFTKVPEAGPSQATQKARECAVSSNAPN